jgi:glutathione reductase (NADPH)
LSKHYDLIAIGAGSGGLSVAERAALHGKRCAVVESGPLGGTCVNVGCVPKKVMWFGAGLAHALEDAAGYGFTLHGHDFDWARLKAARDRYVGGINDWYGNYLADSGIASPPTASSRSRRSRAGWRSWVQATSPSSSPGCSKRSGAR